MEYSEEYLMQFARWLEFNGCVDGTANVAFRILERVNQPLHSLAFVRRRFFDTDDGHMWISTRGVSIQDIFVLMRGFSEDEANYVNIVYATMMFAERDLAVRARLQLGPYIRCVWIFKEEEDQFS